MAKITLFGLAGTGKTSTAKLVAEKLGLEFQSTGNMFRKQAEEAGLTLAELEERSKTESKYDLELDQKVAEYGKTHDNFIFESRLAWHFIPDSFKISLVCDFDERVRRVANREGKDFELAKKETEFREKMISERYEKYYGIKDFAKNENFDFLVDTKKNNLEQVVNAIIEEIKKRGLI